MKLKDKTLDGNLEFQEEIKRNRGVNVWINKRYKHIKEIKFPYYITDYLKQK